MPSNNLGIAMSDMSEKAIVLKLERKYQAPEWAFFSQVPNGTGGNSNQRVDGMAFNLWPSRGLKIIGFEVKSFRSDWLGELKKPWKSEDMQSYCDEWYVVAPKDVVKPEEVPATWGYMLADGRGCKIVKQAPTLPAKSIDRATMAGIMRTIDKSSMIPEEIQERIRRAAADATKAEKERRGWETERTERRLKDVEKTISDFERLSGIHLSAYNMDRIAEAVKAIESDLPGCKGRLEIALENHRKELDVLEKAYKQVGLWRTQSVSGEIAV